MPNICQEKTPIGISRKELLTAGRFYKSDEDAFIARYLDFMDNPAPQQLQFARDMFNLIATDTDTNFITVAPARPGISKSTLITALASFFCTKDNFDYRRESAIGAVIVTDNLERLSDYQKDPGCLQSMWTDEKDFNSVRKYSTFIKSDDDEKSAMELLVQSQYQPVVFLTTQRYFQMSIEQREMLFNYYYTDFSTGKKLKLQREILIFDEKPYFFDTFKIDVKNFNNVDTAIQNGIAESEKTRDDKDWLLSEYRSVRNKMCTLLREKEKTNATVDRFYWKEKNTANLTSCDERFFELIEKHKSGITKEYSNAITDLRAFKTIMVDGAFFVTTKQNVRQNSEYKTFLEMCRDNRDKFFLGENKVKCFVFDATADTDPDYQKDYIKMIDCSKYNVFVPMKIKFFDVPASKSKLVYELDADKRIAAIQEIIADQCVPSTNGNTLIVSYQNIIEKLKCFNCDVGYFGGMRGSNKFREDSKVVHVGNNRYDPHTYFLKLIAKNPIILEKLKSKNEVESRNFINEITKIKHGLFENSAMNDIMFLSVLCDFEQNVFRSAIREYNNQQEVIIYTFWNCKTFKTLNTLIQARYESCGAEFEFMGIPESVKNLKTKLRKPSSGKQTIPQKILAWYGAQQKGRSFKLAEMLNELDMDNDDFRNAKKNPAVKQLFSEIRTETIGRYIVA